MKFIRAPSGQRFPYVSAQAVRFWLRTQLARQAGWTASPVFRETKVAYTDAEPTKYAEDDLFGYMRAASKSTDEKKAAKRAEIAAASTPVDAETGEVTRISPLRVGTMVSTVSVRPTGDFGTMARAEGDPVPHEHQFYRAHLKAPVSLDLTCAGTFFVSKRVGYKNLDPTRQEIAKKAGATEARCVVSMLFGFPSPPGSSVCSTVAALGRLEGGAKQTLHLTDTAPSILILAVCKSGNQPFMRVVGPDEVEENTVFRADVLEEALTVYKDDILSDIYVGWAKGFLDPERKKLEAEIKDGKYGDTGRTVHLKHPREIADDIAKALQNSANATWFD